LLGCEVWLKRDDMTGGAESGNKLRKLEFLLADALAKGADTVLTCGATQSNHARATALLARQHGLDSLLLLRARSEADLAHVGNLALSRASGAHIEFITVAQYRDREQLLAQAAARLEERGKRPYIIPEGGSNGLGALGYVQAVVELREQQRLGLCPPHFDAVVCACGSGGTATGLALGIAELGGAERVDAIAVCDDTPTFEAITQRIAAEARQLCAFSSSTLPLQIHDAYKGPAYAESSPEQRAFQSEISRRVGLIFDPVYTGKALFGLQQLTPKPKRALFIHTGGLPGWLAAPP
jgi:D-cysteine desulfhydrase